MAQQPGLAGGDALRPALTGAGTRKESKVPAIRNVVSSPAAFAAPSIWLLRALLRRYPALAALALTAVFFAACSLRKHAKEKAAQEQPEAQSQAAEEPSSEATPTPPSVTVHISYANRGDYLDSL